MTMTKGFQELNSPLENMYKSHQAASEDELKAVVNTVWEKGVVMENCRKIPYVDLVRYASEEKPLSFPPLSVTLLRQSGLLNFEGTTSDNPLLVLSEDMYQDASKIIGCVATSSLEVMYTDKAKEDAPHLLHLIPSLRKHLDKTAQAIFTPAQAPFTYFNWKDDTLVAWKQALSQLEKYKWVAMDTEWTAGTWWLGLFGKEKVRTELMILPHFRICHQQH
jgi:hypothetical protein